MRLKEHTRHDAIIDLGGMGKVDGNQIGCASLNTAAQRGITYMRAVNDMERVTRARVQQAD